MKKGQDFEHVKERWREFYAGDNSRPMVVCKKANQIIASINYPHPYFLAFRDLEDYIDDIEAWLTGFEYFGDTLPSYLLTFNPDHLALFLGAGLGYNEDSSGTTWTKPVQGELKDLEISFNRQSKWWTRTIEYIERLLKRIKPPAVICGPPIQGGLDCLAALRGTEQMLIDLMEDPYTVKLKLAEINKKIVEVRKALWEVQDGDTRGAVNRFGMYSDTFTDVPQCDMSCMINNKMFEIFQVPALVEECGMLQDAVYHLDGPGALQHRNSLFDIDTISMIQWQPGSGNYEKNWFSLYEEIDEHGKGLVLQSFTKMNRKEMVDFWKTCKSKKILYILEPGQVDDIDSFIAELEAAGK